MLKQFYKWLYRVTAHSDERGEYSGGRWEGLIRKETLELCGGVRGKALEIGSGTGLFVLKLAAREPGLEVWGVDINPERLKLTEDKAREQGITNLRLKFENAKSLSFDDNTFDRVACINLFLNMDLAATAVLMKEAKRVCKTGGRIIFDFRNSRNLFFVLKYKLVRLYDDTAPYPLYTHNPARIDVFLREAGLNVVQKRYLGFPVKWCAPIIIVEAEKP